MLVGIVGLAGMPAWAEQAAAVTDAQPAAPKDAAPSGAVVGPGMDVSLEYTLQVDGKIVDTTDGKPAFHYVHGRRQLIHGLERQLQGMRVGESKQLTVSPDEGYGTADPNAFIEVSKSQLPTGVEPKTGMILRGVNPGGQPFQATIHEMKDSTVVLDLNHPLAGKTLNFDVKVTDIQPAPPEPPPAAQAAQPASPPAAQPPAAAAPAPDTAPAK